MGGGEGGDGEEGEGHESLRPPAFWSGAGTQWKWQAADSRLRFQHGKGTAFPPQAASALPRPGAGLLTQ